jgi:hypothetical protein
VVTTVVATRLDRDTLLRMSADALRSGRLERFTAEWRAELADACESAADDLKPDAARNTAGNTG